MLKRLREAGKRHSQTDMQAIQGIHDMSVQAGADCPGMQESWPPMADAATIHESSGLSQSDLAALLRTALGDRYPNRGVYLRDVYGDSVVFTVYQDGNGGTYEAPYALSDPDGDGIPEKATIGDPVEVMGVTSYVPVAESGDPLEERAYTQDQRNAMMAKGMAMEPDGAYPIATKADLANAIQAYGRAKNQAAVKAHITKRAKAMGMTDMLPADWEGSTQKQEAAGEPVELTGDLIPLTEKSVRNDGTVNLCLITPGQGSSGYYPAEVIKRDGPKAFIKGTHTYIDHPTISEERDHPERSVTRLAGTLTSDARWDEHGPAGPGLYAQAKVRSDLAPLIEDLAPHIGVSIRALGTAGTREIDGKKVRTIESIDQARSADYVTTAGRGGRVLDLIESARGGRAPHQQEEDGMNLEEALARIAELEAAKPDALAAQRLGEANQRIETLEREKARLQEQTILRDAEAVIAETLAGFELHQMTRDRVAKDLMRDFPVRDGALDKEAFATRVTEAAKAEQNYLIVSTGSNGRVRGMGGGANGEPDYDAELAALYEAQGYGKEIAARMAR